MANWQQIDELNDISADLPRFSDALRWPNGWDWSLRRWTPTIFSALSSKYDGGALAAGAGALRHVTIGKYH